MVKLFKATLFDFAGGQPEPEYELLTVSSDSEEEGEVEEEMEEEGEVLSDFDEVACQFCDTSSPSPMENIGHALVTHFFPGKVERYL